MGGRSQSAIPIGAEEAEESIYSGRTGVCPGQFPDVWTLAMRACPRSNTRSAQARRRHNGDTLRQTTWVERAARLCEPPLNGAAGFDRGGRGGGCGGIMSGWTASVTIPGIMGV